MNLVAVSVQPQCLILILPHSLHVMHKPKMEFVVFLIMNLTQLGRRRLLSVDLLIADNSCEYLQLCICILQQSQLSHYPERKIDDFRQHIEKLETEYKRFLKKLRSLDLPANTSLGNLEHIPRGGRIQSAIKTPVSLCYYSTGLCLTMPTLSI